MKSLWELNTTEPTKNIYIQNKAKEVRQNALLFDCQLLLVEHEKRGANGVVGIYDELIVVQNIANFGKNLENAQVD